MIAFTSNAGIATCSPNSADPKPTSDTRLREQARELVRREIAYVPNRAFLDRAQATALSDDRDLLTTVESPTNAGATRRDLPGHLARLCAGGLLSAADEARLFQRMNFLKFRANQHRSRLDPDCPDRVVLETVTRLLDKAQAIRDRLIESNMRLVVSIARKFVTPQNSFDDLLSDGVMTLIRAVEKFDYDRGFRFSTYAYRAISRNLFRIVVGRRKELSQLGGFNARVEDVLEDRSRPEALDRQEQQQRELLTQFVNRLPSRERFVLRSRFALGRHRKKRTCRELGQILGVSRERVRQIERRAIAKLESMAASVD